MSAFIAAKVVMLASDFFNHRGARRDIHFADGVLHHHILRGQGRIGGLPASKIANGFPDHQKQNDQKNQDDNDAPHDWSLSEIAVMGIASQYTDFFSLGQCPGPADPGPGLPDECSP